MEQVPAAIIEDDQCHDAAGLLLLVGVSSRASILVGQVPHSVGLGNMAEKTKHTTSNHRNIQDASRPPPHTATLPPRTSPMYKTPQYPTISLVDMRHPYTLTTPYYFFHFKLQASNFTGTLSHRWHAAKDRHIVALLAVGTRSTMAQTGVSGPVVVDGGSFLDALFACACRG